MYTDFHLLYSTRYTIMFGDSLWTISCLATQIKCVNVSHTLYMQWLYGVEFYQHLCQLSMQASYSVAVMVHLSCKHTCPVQRTCYMYAVSSSTCGEPVSAALLMKNVGSIVATS